MPELALRDAQRVHLVGIGGAGMAALATLLLGMGKTLRGSDLGQSPVIERLRARGAVIYPEHAAEQLGAAQYVVRSSAVPQDNPEVQEALRRGLPTKKLAEAVGELMQDRTGVAIAGTHGKTTTTTLVTWLLEQGGCDPLALIGGDTPRYPDGARLGAGPMVVEADEYDRRFLQFWPHVLVVTSIEADHLDYYHDLAEIRGAFQELAWRVPADGHLIVCADQPDAAALEGRARRETYGFSGDADWQLSQYQPVPEGGSRFLLTTQGRSWSVRSPLIGEHNARNVAAAIAVADAFGVGLSAALAAVRGVEGAARRFETKGRPRGIWIVDDYGHHPTEVAAVLQAARGVAEGDVWIVFQPHTTHRTAALFDEFAQCFAAAQHALILPIYRPSGRERSERITTSAELVQAVQQRGHADARVVADFSSACAAIVAEARPGDLVLTMGAGDITVLSQMLVEALAG